MISKSILNYPSIKSTLIDLGDGKNQFIVEPLLHGYGYTLGNSLRRILLSSIPGCAVVAVRVNDLTHEYQSIDGVVEDVIDIILNIKSLVVKNISDLPQVIRIEKHEKGVVTAANIITTEAVQIINPEHVIATLTDDVPFKVEMTVENGRGYRMAEENVKFRGKRWPRASPKLVSIDCREVIGDRATMMERNCRSATMET